MKHVRAWLPAFVLSLGALLTVGIDTQRSMSLEAALDSVIPLDIAGRFAQDLPVSPAEIEAAGVTSYVMRTYATEAEARPDWSLYVGYYERQLRGRSIHSPKNCLPGAGWEALASREIALETPAGPVPVNRYLLQKDGRQALVLYWYQGRGRVVANEYLVKVNLLRDAALRQRSDEALVRIVVPIVETEEEAYRIAAEAARTVVPNLNRALPG